MDGDNEDRDLRDTIIEQGEEVYQLFWDSGGPGAGADSECIYRYMGKYYPILSFDDDTQPYGTLEEALIESEINSITDAVEEIRSTELATSELVNILKFIGEDARNILINGETWYVSTAGLERRK